jgi:transcriptional regulator GlxA family with amidase domain
MENTIKRSVVFYLVPNFSMIAFSTAIEPLILSNRLQEQPSYQWHLASFDGEPVTASNGVQVSVDKSLKQERETLLSSKRPSMLLVCSGTNVEEHENKTLFAYLRENKNQGVIVGGLCTGAYMLAAAGMLDNKRCAIHWENLPGFTERFPKIDVYADLYEMEDGVCTCAGGTASLDMMLSIIGEDHGQELVNQVCEQALTDRVRNPQDRQRLPLRARLGVQNTKVLSIIEYMEANITEPLPLVKIASFVGLSRRQIERLFQNHMGRSPARYYLEVRLDRARHLLMQSSLPVVEVAIASGFISASHFSKCYRELYGKSPLQERG